MPDSSLSETAGAAGVFFAFDEPARLLVADDDPILREFACVHLAGANVEIDMAADGAEALTLLRAQSYDLALVDLDMPVLDGFSLIAQVRADEALAHLPIVVVTGREDMSAIDRAFQIGATSFVVKPLNWRLLGYQLRYVLRASRQEREVRAAKHRAEQALAFKANVLRLVQHELRTPLTSIIGFAEQIERNPKGESTADFARYIRRAGRTFAGQVSDLLNAASILTQSIDLRLDDVRAQSIVDAVVREESSLAQSKSVALRGFDATDGAVVECDRALVQRAVGQLVRNAILHGAPPVELVATKDSVGAVSFVVRDRGAGVPQDRLVTCFEPFQQTENALVRGEGGVGLGLPVARRIIEVHGGALTLQHIPEVGCIAVASLPATPTAPETPERRRA